MGTVALTSNFNAGPANATDCEPLYVSWRWDLERHGDFHMSVDAENITGESGSSVPDTDSLGGSFLVRLLFDEPTDYCEKLGNAPTENSLRVTGYFSGLLSTTFVQFNHLIGAPATTLAGASASVDILPEFDKQELFFSGEKEIFQDKSKVITVKNGDRIPFAGNLDALAYKGSHFFSSNFSRAVAQLYVNGAFIEPQSGWVKYTIPTKGTPEPLTMLASATAVGFAAFFKRKHSKKQKKS
jgi:hypothetical protein